MDSFIFEPTPWLNVCLHGIVSLFVVAVVLVGIDTVRRKAFGGIVEEDGRAPAKVRAIYALIALPILLVGGYWMAGIYPVSASIGEGRLELQYEFPRPSTSIALADIKSIQFKHYRAEAGVTRRSGSAEFWDLTLQGDAGVLLQGGLDDGDAARGLVLKLATLTKLPADEVTEATLVDNQPGYVTPIATAVVN